MQWSHSVLGKFDITDEWIGLDLSRLYLDPVRASVTYVHELCHAALSGTTEMGTATNAIFRIAPRFTHLNDKSRDELLSVLVQSQKFPQEGFATFIEMAQLRRLTSKSDALAAKSDLHQEYRDFFESMEFMFSKSLQRRDLFTSKISHLCMQTGFKRDVVAQNLLSSTAVLREYLQVVDNNPSLRLEKILEMLRYKDYMVTKSPEEIAKAAGIGYFPPANKMEVADFINYLYGMADIPQTHTPEMVGEADENQILSTANDSILVTNVNLDLSNTSMFLYKPEDIEYEATYAEAAYVVYHTPVPNADKFFEDVIGNKLDVALLFFSQTGEKYLAVTSLTHAQSLLVNELQGAVIVTKWGICDPVTGTFSISDKRKPDVILYNRPQDMLATFTASNGQISSYERIYLAAMQGHPFHSLVVRVNGHSPLHMCHGFGNVQINNILNLINAKSRIMALSELDAYAREINDALSILGLSWNVDWVRTMIDGSQLVRR